MSTDVITPSIKETSPRFKARVAGLFYLVVFVAGGAALFLRGSPAGAAAGLIAGATYVVVTLLFYGIFKPVSRRLSMLAAFFSLTGCAVGALGAFHLLPFRIDPLVFFGIYCLLIGYLIFRSNFLPRILGAGMMIAGLGWLTFLSPTLATALAPYNFAPGILGEGLLTLWLVVMGVDADRWREQASATTHGRAIAS